MARQILFKLFVVWFIVGVILVGFDLIPPALEWANSVFLILAGGVALLYSTVHFGKKEGIALSVAIGVSTFLIEGFSAKLDVFFGNYDYTAKFPPLLFGVPIGIAFAWIVMIMSANAFTTSIPNRFLRAFFAGLYVVALDLVLDPVAYVAKQYWIWEHPESSYYGIPWTNFAGWFAIAFVWQFILTFVPVKDVATVGKRQVKFVFWAIVTLFVVVAAANGLYISIVVSLISLIGLELIRRNVYEAA